MDRERLTRFSTLVDTDSDDDVRDTMVDESPGRWALGGGGPKGWEPEPRKSGGPEGWGPKGWEARNFALFFFPLPPQISFILGLWPLFKAMAHPKCGFLLVSCFHGGPPSSERNVTCGFRARCVRSAWSPFP